MRSRWLGLALAVLLAGFAAAVYGRLPEQVPVHWDTAGEPDNWMPRFPGAFVSPLIVAGVWLLAVLLPRIDPRRAHYRRFSDTYWLVLNLTLLFLGAFGVLSLGVALGWPVDMGRVAAAGTGLLFVGLGNYMPRVRSNWWLGVRTPWTLSSESVWQRTHRLAGRAFVLSGLVLISSAWLPPDSRGPVVLGAVGVAALAPTAYSYFLWSREQREDGSPGTRSGA